MRPIGKKKQPKGCGGCMAWGVTVPGRASTLGLVPGGWNGDDNDLHHHHHHHHHHHYRHHQRDCVNDNHQRRRTVAPPPPFPLLSGSFFSTRKCKSIRFRRLPFVLRFFVFGVFFIFALNGRPANLLLLPKSHRNVTDFSSLVMAFFATFTGFYRVFFKLLCQLP